MDCYLSGLLKVRQISHNLWGSLLLGISKVSIVDLPVMGAPMCRLACDLVAMFLLVLIVYRVKAGSRPPWIHTSRGVIITCIILGARISVREYGDITLVRL